MLRPKASAIENVFQPAKEADTPERFAGRKQAIIDSYYGLVSSGNNIAIVGNRGIGKTSLAKQILGISSGSDELLKKVDIYDENDLNFLPIYFACGDNINGYEDILEKLLTIKNCLGEWIYEIPEAKKIIEKYNPKFSIGAISLTGEKRKENSFREAISDHKIDVIFTNVVQLIIEAKIARGILFVIDEYDQVKDPKGFASFLKSSATNIPFAKFVIVGVAHDIHNLMREHESSDRLFAGSIITLPKMAVGELWEIISIAENSINKYITFDAGAKTELGKLAQGHPYFLHLIGKFALRSAYHNNRNSITKEDIKTTVRDIAENALDPTMEHRYRTAVGTSQQREVVLKSFAKVQSTDSEVSTTKAYKIALDNGVDNSSQYVGHLTSSLFGGELIKVRERYYRFKDSLFVAYINARPSLNSGDREGGEY